MASKQITLRVSDDAIATLDAFAKRSGVSRSRLLAEAIEVYSAMLSRGIRGIPDATAAVGGFDLGDDDAGESRGPGRRKTRRIERGRRSQADDSGTSEPSADYLRPSA